MISFKHSFLFASILMVILCQINVLASNSGPQRNRRQQRVNRNDQRRTVEDLINGLRAVVPSSSRTTESLLDDTNNYIRNLQHQVNTLSDRFGNLTDEEWQEVYSIIGNQDLNGNTRNTQIQQIMQTAQERANNAQLPANPQNRANTRNQHRGPNNNLNDE